MNWCMDTCAHEKALGHSSRYTMASLSGKVIVITGAGSGLGAFMAWHLTRFNPRLALLGRNVKALEDTMRQCRESGLRSQQLLTQEVDLLRESDIHQSVNSVVDRFGKIDVLVNNAGVAIFSDLAGTKMADWDKMMTVNVRAPFLLTKLCLPHLIETKGCVINISSVQAQTMMPGCIAYAMGKASLDHFSRILAADVGKYNVRVNTVSPGFIENGIHLKNGMALDAYQDYAALQKASTPLGGCALPSDIAHAVAFLASDDAAFITGETIRVDGGKAVAGPGPVTVSRLFGPEEERREPLVTEETGRPRIFFNEGSGKA
ncbi:3-oxoacyl-[acyl-carrier-protein] reductase FabG-like [Babylonia areolata]|uniref:3-oxoacyl-[acyl-carrier-protein] reductase FabG-like n=1 Tax=Babylonia areolata TaxID=304850 RepID=UPI003FD0F50E